MNTSTIIGLKLGIAALPTVSVIVGRAAYAAGKKDRLAVELHDA